MIKLAENISELCEFKKLDVFSVRIFSLANAYGFNYDFATFWVQKTHRSTTAILSRLDNNVTLSFDSSSDIDELKDFLSMLSFGTLMCSDRFEINCSFESGFVMEKLKNNSFQCNNDVAIEPIPLQDLFRLNKCSLSGVDYDAFYADMNHKIRHGALKAYGAKFQDEFVSSAALTSIFHQYSVLSFVATDKNFRNMGFASKIVDSISSDNKMKYFLIRKSNENKSFYNKLGFINTEKWRIYKNDTFF